VSNVDIFFVVFFIIAAILGYKAGIVRMLLGLLGILLGMFLLYYYRQSFLIHAQELAEQYPYLSLFILSFYLIGCSVLFIYIAILIEKFLKLVFLNWVNRLVGALAAVLITIAMISSVLIVLVRFPSHKPMVSRTQLQSSVVAKMVFWAEARWFYFPNSEDSLQ